MGHSKYQLNFCLFTSSINIVHTSVFVVCSKIKDTTNSLCFNNSLSVCCLYREQGLNYYECLL